MKVWLRRLASRSPLVRTADRVEAAALAMVAGASVLTIPVAGAVGTAQYDRLAAEFAAQRHTYQTVAATVVGERAAPEPYEQPSLTEIRWVFAGAEHTADLATVAPDAGAPLTISVDRSGNLVRNVPAREDAAIQAVLAALGVWCAVSGGGAMAWLLLRARLNRLRHAAWDRELDDLADNGGRTGRETT
ncbi:Rv1733c family protein [Mycolicibacterium vaccae]|uniref:Rv1733c family protein n=1 Tax=Mycolicibacterium vaccae TaxID=1810 RepID=UPI003CF1FA3E